MLIFMQSLSGHTSPVEAVRFGNAEEMVVAGSMSGALKLWDLEQAKSKLSINVVSQSVITCRAGFMTRTSVNVSSSLYATTLECRRLCQAYKHGLCDGQPLEQSMCCNTSHTIHQNLQCMIYPHCTVSQVLQIRGYEFKLPARFYHCLSRRLG